MRRPIPRPLLFAGLVLALAALVGLSLMAGRVHVPFAALTDRSDPRWAIIFALRLPRTLLGLVIGAALGMSGAAMQGYTRNPLADPGVLGVSAMAAFGAVMTLYLGAAGGQNWVVAAGAMAGAFTGGCGLLLLTGRSLDALTLGETSARSLGVNLTVLRWLLAAGLALTAGASVAVTGVISFVGLVTPHLLRPFVGARPGALLIPSAIGGAVLVLVGDIAVRLIPSAGEVKLGVAMAVLGGPFFFALLLSMRRRMA